MLQPQRTVRKTMAITPNLFTGAVDKSFLLLCMLVAGCASTDKADDDHVHGPGCAHEVRSQVAVPYYIPEQSLRLPPHARPHADHPPLVPLDGDVVYSKQNRFPVVAKHQYMPARDLGAAYDMDGQQHVLVRHPSHTRQSDIDTNPLNNPKARMHLRDPECFHSSTGLQHGMVDRCGEVPPPERIIRSKPPEVAAASAAAPLPIPADRSALPPPPPKPPARRAPIRVSDQHCYRDGDSLVCVDQK